MTRTVPSTFRVRVYKMVESHRETYWVTMDRGDRPIDEKPFNTKGRIQPFMSEDPVKATIEAESWARFLGVYVDYDESDVDPLPEGHWAYMMIIDED